MVSAESSRTKGKSRFARKYSPVENRLKIPEGYVIIEMYNTSRNEIHQPVRGGVLINDENYWPVKLKHRGSGHIKWVNLHSDEPTVQSIVKETTENAMF